MLNPWNPYRELSNIRDEMNRLFWERYGEPSGGDRTGPEILADMYENDDYLVVTAALPGVKPGDIEVTITGNRLNIRGEFQREQEEENSNIHFQERRYGRFQRNIALPSNIDSNEIGATFTDGILKITLPKSEKDRPKQIPVKLQQK